MSRARPAVVPPVALLGAVATGVLTVSACGSTEDERAAADGAEEFGDSRP
jgi:hypothetical protein